MVITLNNQKQAVNSEDLCFEWDDNYYFAMLGIKMNITIDADDKTILKIFADNKISRVKYWIKDKLSKNKDVITGIINGTYTYFPMTYDEYNTDIRLEKLNSLGTNEKKEAVQNILVVKQLIYDYSTYLEMLKLSNYEDGCGKFAVKSDSKYGTVIYENVKLCDYISIDNKELLSDNYKEVLMQVLNSILSEFSE